MLEEVRFGGCLVDIGCISRRLRAGKTSAVMHTATVFRTSKQTRAVASSSRKDDEPRG